MGGIGSGAKPRQYPADIVELATRLYNAGHTVREVQDHLPRGYKAQRILERYLPERRTTAKRDQRGPANDMWKGDDAGYQAAHLRLGRAADHPCTDCGTLAAHWSYIGGAPDERPSKRGVPYSTDPTYYQPRCVTCHHHFDQRARRANGQFASREEVA